jgi:hypothetical protein
MRIVETKVYTFGELSEAAKEKARQWWRDIPDTWEPNFEAAETAAKLLGITFDQRNIKLMSGNYRQESDILYSGFYSQGDGLSFNGRYEYAQGCVYKIADEFPKDATLQRIADDLASLQRQYFYGLTAKIEQRGRYVHKYTMNAEVYDRHGEDANEKTHDEILELMRDFADWIYDGLREDYEWQQADEQVDETLILNEYEFLEDGSRA